MPAIRIAEAMKVDRNTINNDLKILYSELAQELNASTYADLIERQLVRLETQRDRLTTHLADATESEERLATERLIADIDFKLMATLTKIQFSTYNHVIDVARDVNARMTQLGLGKAYVGLDEFLAITIKSRQNLDEVGKKVKRWP
jgi:hypothetical protein